MESGKNMYVIPEQGKWCFATWKVDFLVFTLGELEITDYSITFFIRIMHRVFKWEYTRRRTYDVERLKQEFDDE